MGQAGCPGCPQWRPPQEDKLIGEDSSPERGIWWGLSAAQGRRKHMEDTVVAVPSLATETQSLDLHAQWVRTSLFAVFDGHGGDTVSRFCEANIASIVSTYPKTDISNSLVAAFHRLDDKLRASTHRGAGSTALVSCIDETHIVVGNAGDCRAVLCRAGEAIELSQDHKPSLEGEQARIEAAGAQVTVDNCDADARINGDLAVSRGLGDFHLKNVSGFASHEQPVIPTPDIEIVERNSEDEFMILACDGVWDVLSSQNAVDWIQKALGERSDLANRLQDGSLDLAHTAESFLDYCLGPRLQLLCGIGEDNMSVIIIVFLHAGGQAGGQA